MNSNSHGNSASNSGYGIEHASHDSDIVPKRIMVPYR